MNKKNLEALRLAAARATTDRAQACGSVHTPYADKRAAVVAENHAFAALRKAGYHGSTARAVLTNPNEFNRQAEKGRNAQ